MNMNPTEAQEQTELFARATLLSKRHPELRLLFHIPNGGSRHPAEAARLKAQGVKPGVPDICLPVPKKKYHGLYIELKRRSGGVVSEAQNAMLTALRRQGYKVAICFGCDDAWKTISEYLEF